jgi:hypothetical protein
MRKPEPRDEISSTSPSSIRGFGLDGAFGRHPPLSGDDPAGDIAAFQSLLRSAFEKPDALVFVL